MPKGQRFKMELIQRGHPLLLFKEIVNGGAT